MQVHGRGVQGRQGARRRQRVEGGPQRRQAVRLVHPGETGMLSGTCRSAEERNPQFPSLTSWERSQAGRGLPSAGRGVRRPPHKTPSGQPNHPPWIRLQPPQPPRLILQPPASPRDPQIRAWRCPPEGGVREGVMRQVAGVVVSSGGGRIQSEGRQGGHAEVLGGVVGTKTAQVILSDGAGRHHVVDWPLQAGEAGRWSPSHPVPL